MGRSPCCEKAHTNKGAWSKQEDETLIAYIQAHGEGCWRTLPKAAGLQRCGKSCRLRWINYLRPDLKRGNFTPEEDELIIKLHSILGNKWSLIAGKLPGRTDNEIKNYWNTHIKKKLLERGIDPYTHRPVARSASEDSSSNDTCHVRATSEVFTDFFQQEQATDFFQQEQATDFFQQHKQVTTASSVDQDVNSTYHGGNSDVNLELSITLPSIAYGGSFTHQSSNGEFGFFNGEGMSSGSKYVSHESKNSVCCHIGLQCGCCSNS